MLDTARLAPCDLDETTVLTYNTGYTLEGAAVLANLSAWADDGQTLHESWRVRYTVIYCSMLTLL